MGSSNQIAWKQISIRESASPFVVGLEHIYYVRLWAFTVIFGGSGELSCSMSGAFGWPPPCNPC